MFANERKILSLCVVILVCWGATLKTSAPTIYIEDSGQFVSSVATLGHNHPPGYILYNLLAHPLTRLPLGEIAFRVNLFSGLGGVGALCFLFWLTAALFKDDYVVIFTCLLLIFSRSFWFLNSQSEVYQLNLMFFGGALYWLWLAKNRSGKTYSRLLYLWLGLGFNNHYLLILFAPLIILYEYSGRSGRGWKENLTRWNLLLLGYGVSLALPLRSARGVVMDWGQPNNWNRFFHLLRRTQFKSLEFSRSVAFSDKLNFIREFFRELAGQFYFATLILALFGLYWLYRNRRRWFNLLASIWLLGGIGIIFLLHFPFNFENRTRFSVYYLPIFWLTAVFIGAGLKYFRERERFSQTWSLFFLLLPLGIGIINFPRVNLRNNFLGFDQGCNLLLNLPEGAVLFAQGNNIVFPLSYLQQVLKARSDVVIYDQSGGVFPPGAPGSSLGNRPEFFTLMRSRPTSLKTVPYGLLFQKSDQPLEFTEERYFRWRYRNTLSYGENEILAARFYFKGLALLRLNQVTRAYRFFGQSVQVGKDILWLRNNLGQLYLARNLYPLAKREFQEAVRLDPFNPVVHFNLGRAIAKYEKDYPTASRHFSAALKFDPGYTKARQALATAERLGSVDEKRPH